MIKIEFIDATIVLSVIINTYKKSSLKQLVVINVDYPFPSFIGSKQKSW